MCVCVRTRVHAHVCVRGIVRCDGIGKFTVFFAGRFACVVKQGGGGPPSRHQRAEQKQNARTPERTVQESIEGWHLRGGKEACRAVGKRRESRIIALNPIFRVFGLWDSMLRRYLTAYFLFDTDYH